MKKNDFAFIFLMILSLSVGYVFGSITTINHIRSSESGKIVTISSIDDNQEVHSIVVIDAIISAGDSVKVYINDELKADYVPFYWNNINEPVGNYSILVEIMDSEGNIIGNDTKTVVIPKKFVVPQNYTFDEDFVVHEGQEVIFRDYDFSISSEGNTNGFDGIDNKVYYSLNSFGNITIINASITAECFIFEKNSQTVLINDSSLHGLGIGIYKAENHNTYTINGIRFNNNAKLYIYNNPSYYRVTVNTPYFNELTDDRGGDMYSFIAPATYQFL